MRERIWILLNILFSHIDLSYVKKWRKDYPDVLDLLPRLGKIEKDFLIQTITVLGMIWSDGRVDGTERQYFQQLLIERRIPIGFKVKWNLRKLLKKPITLEDVKEFYNHIGYPPEQLLNQIVNIENRVNRNFSSQYMIYFNGIRNFLDIKIKTKAS